jgi:hypothetical protein
MDVANVLLLATNPLIERRIVTTGERVGTTGDDAGTTGQRWERATPQAK